MVGILLGIGICGVWCFNVYSVFQVGLFHYTYVYGVEQGSTLGPLLFTIYISPLKYIIEQTPNVKYHIYMRMKFKFTLNLVLTIN